MPIDLTSSVVYIKKIRIFESQNNTYFIGTHNLKKEFHVLIFKKIKFDTENKQLASTINLSDIMNEKIFSSEKTTFSELLQLLSKGTRQKLKFVNEIQCIFGFVKFFLGYYSIIVTDSSIVGRIGRHLINRVEKVTIFPLFNIDQTLFTDNVYSLENKYFSLFKNFELTRQMFYSKSYDLTKTVQRNFIENLKCDIIPNFTSHYFNKKNKISLNKITNNTFLWNHFHLKEFLSISQKTIWIVFFIYGYFEQVECNIFGLRFLVTIIARRNRHYAGTRFLKRGVSVTGNVANEVETEQILEEISSTWSDQPQISSFIHIRGSVPIHWYQEHTFLLTKPTIKVNLSDITFNMTKRHFMLLTERYGKPCIVCNLTKKKELHKKQETLLNEWYQAAVDFINQTSMKNENKIIYHHYDLKADRLNMNFYEIYSEHSLKLIEQTNMFCFVPFLKDKNVFLLSLQNGIIRSNCVDCVDRTNVFQQIIGFSVFKIQLRKLGVMANFPEKETEEISNVLTDMYKRMGHELSMQYAGSLAHKQSIKEKGSQLEKLINKFSEVFNTSKRYFNNSFNDQNKQSSINVFLGKYKVNSGLPNIWEMFNDNILHSKYCEEMGDDWFDNAVNEYCLFNLVNDCIKSQNGLVDFVEKKVIIDTAFKNDPIYCQFTNDRDYLVSFDNYIKFKLKNTNLFKDKIIFEREVSLYYYFDKEYQIQIFNFFHFNFSSTSSVIVTNNLSQPPTLKTSQTVVNLLSRHPTRVFSLFKDDMAKTNRSNRNSNAYLTPSYTMTRCSNTPVFESSILKNNHPLRKIRKLLFPSKSIISPNILSDKRDEKFNLSFFGDDISSVANIKNFLSNDMSNSEYYNQLDSFVSMNINGSNYNEIFEVSNLETSSVPFPEDFTALLSQRENSSESFNHQKTSLRPGSKIIDKEEENDHLIYIVDENCFYKKIRATTARHYHHHSGDNVTSRKASKRKKSTEDFEGNKENFIFEIRKEINGPNWSGRDLSPKAKVNVKSLPFKVMENFYDT